MAYKPADISNTDTAIKTEKLRFALILCFVVSLPFPVIYSQAILGLLVATTLMSFRIAMLKAIPKKAWLFMGLYLLGATGYLYSTDKHEAGYLLERQLTILIMPIAIPMAFRITKERIQLMLFAFTLSCMFAIFFLFGQALYTIRLNQFPWKLLFTNTFFHHGFSGPLGIHATYLSLYVSLCIFYCSHRLFKTKTTGVRLGMAFCLAVLLSGLLFLASRSVLIGMACILLFVFPLFVVRKKWLYYIIIPALSVLVIFMIFQVDYFQNRFGKQLVGEIYTPHAMAMTDASPEPRVERWKGALELIKLSPWIGYGTGDEIRFLKVKYLEHRQFVSYLYSFNAHNEYLSYTIKHGVIGLIVFLGLFWYYLRLGIRKRFFVYVAFIGILLVTFITENVLDSNKGIFFFAFFNTVFGYWSLCEDSFDEISSLRSE